MTFASLTPLETGVCIAGVLFGIYLTLFGLCRQSARAEEDARRVRLRDRAFTQADLERIENERNERMVRELRRELDSLPTAQGHPHFGSGS